MRLGPGRVQCGRELQRRQRPGRGARCSPPCKALFFQINPVPMLFCYGVCCCCFCSAQLFPTEGWRACCAAQDVRTWKVLWEGQAGCTTFGCCYLPAQPHRLAAAGPGNSLFLFDTGVQSPADGSSGSGTAGRDPAIILHHEAGPQRQLLCVSASPDGLSLAASGVGQLRYGLSPAWHVDMRRS